MAYEFHHVHIKSADPKKTAEWYVKAFNFTILSDAERPWGDRMVRCRMADGSGVNISNARTGDNAGGRGRQRPLGSRALGGIKGDDVDAEIERLTGLGAQLLEGPLDVPNGPRIAFLKTHGDVRVEIIQ